MRKIQVSLLIISLLLVSCDKKEVIAYNDSIVECQEVVVREYVSFNQKLATSTPSLSFDSIGPEAEKAVKIIETEISKISNLTSPENGEKFKESAVELFQSIKLLINIGSEFSILNEHSPQDSVNMMIERYNKQSEDYKFKNSEMLKVQQNYANDKGINIES